MAAKAHEHVGALLHGVEEVDLADRAARAAGDAVLDGEEDGRDVIAVDDAARHDALHALVPTLAADDDAAASLVGPLDLGHGGLGERGLYVAALGVDLLELARKDGRLRWVVGEQQVKGHVRRAHAARGVQARDDGEGQAVGRDLGDVLARRRREGHQAGPGDPAHAREALCHQGAVLALEQHHVGERAQRGHVGVVEPEVGLAQAAPQLADELQGHAGAGELAGGTVGGELGVGHGNALGHEVGRLVVVGHHDVDALGDEPRHLLAGSDAVVHGDDEVGLAGLPHAGQGLAGQAVPLAEAVGDEGVDIGA